MGKVEFAESYHMGRLNVPEWALVRMKDIVYDNGRVIEATVQTTQGEVRQQKAEVIALQTQIAVEREEYDEAYQAIVDSVDLAEIYERATADLKMVRAKNSQIYTYTNKKSDMVRQYADIPGAD